MDAGLVDIHIDLEGFGTQFMDPVAVLTGRVAGAQMVDQRITERPFDFLMPQTLAERVERIACELAHLDAYCCGAVDPPSGIAGSPSLR